MTEQDRIYNRNRNVRLGCRVKSIFSLLCQNQTAMHPTKLKTVLLESKFSPCSQSSVCTWSTSCQFDLCALKITRVLQMKTFKCNVARNDKSDLYVRTRGPRTRLGSMCGGLIPLHFHTDGEVIVGSAALSSLTYFNHPPESRVLTSHQLDQLVKVSPRATSDAC